MSESVAYPMWVIVCDHCGPTNTLWEKPGTAGSYVRRCPGCGTDWVTTERAENKAEHEELMGGESDE